MVERWTRERRLEHTRSLLLDAAEEVFAEKGFMAASLDDIAHAAGYTKGAIYKHFAAKEDLFLAVLARHEERLAVPPGAFQPRCHFRVHKPGGNRIYIDSQRADFARQ